MRFMLTPIDPAEDMRNHVFSIGRFALIERIHEDMLEVVVMTKAQHFDLSEYCDKNELNIIDK
ncbi:MAG: hypothetical protein A3G49_00940 [Candidatus Sungbacteria bacterium RIFCSPLOWO2_12_FULL_41_11]|uniref:Uncharacterized protein n=1 Tax=Candidatus Sungbacteria bacterium RIFCSPLOWO2_12_FULL_41_11 TaxID=1802286 RepID=A0A1G2LPM0_9BACT|nr:MAG: hypothetical protein UV01_C0010G0094 [Parcubacteria group bacterium GW2011_GWA2_42_14]OGZ98453.1 MAG: hypothetical protein A3D41_05110 [Candidatus Sungbacteria bacterium RIFCSPHIGHO2_02_FULL_41_12b]OHA13547.1 MAG: hypothetical protein A3G49_00940 [Candidatus Sungbacteria bacterium RIFCSPLOWO2_12_FULL_41_11]